MSQYRSNVSRPMGPVNENGDSKRESSEYEPHTSQIQKPPDMVDRWGRPVDRSKTGTWRAAPFINAINLADFQATVGVPINLVPYLAATMHQPLSKAATINTNFLGTQYLLAVLGGFLADSYVGTFFTICGGAISVMLGLGVLILSTALSTLQPAPCGPTGPCKPAGAKYMVPLYVALYTIAFGTGLVKPNTASFGGDQYDQSSPKERKQGVHFFVWFYFFINIGLLTCFSLGVYLQDDVSRSWGYGFSLILCGVAFLFFIMGFNIFRHKMPAGSFLTRMAQVFVASFRKWKATVPADPEKLYNPAVTRLKVRLNHTRTLRFFDRAAVIDEADKNALGAERPDPWRLCSVTQVEESKRLIQFIPIWITLTPATLVFAQLSTFTVQQGQTLDRKLGQHFVIPAASLAVMMPMSALVCVPIYDFLFVPFAKKYTRSPYGISPLQRLGTSLFFAMCTMVCAALVERKRLTYVREMHLQALPLGAYALPMKFWYLLPQYFCAAQVEFFLYIASYQFYYHEAADTTRSVGTSYTYSASAMGYYFSTVIVNLTNHFTRNNHGGSWTRENLNDGGLEKFYWLLAVFITVDLMIFFVVAYLYQYKHDWYRPEDAEPETEDGVVPRMQSGRVEPIHNIEN